MAGAVAEAAGLLGYRWTIPGTVQKGAQLGRTLGYPTANIAIEPDSLLKYGIYAVRLRRADGTLHDGVASFGRRPTFDDGAALFETFLFDFSDDLYGETVRVSLFAFLRGEERFDGAEALIAQMDRDAEEARAMLAGVTPLCELDGRSRSEALPVLLVVVRHALAEHDGEADLRAGEGQAEEVDDQREGEPSQVGLTHHAAEPTDIDHDQRNRHHRRGRKADQRVAQ